MANVHELTVILTGKAGSEGNKELLLEQSSKQVDSITAGSSNGPPEVSGSYLATNTFSEAPSVTLSPAHNLESDNAARSRSPVHWQHSTINLHNV